MSKLLITLLIIAFLACSVIVDAKKVLKVDKRPFCDDKDPCVTPPKISKKKFCNLRKLKFGCHQRVCCLNFYRNGNYSHKKCKKGPQSCPIKKRRWCKIIKSMVNGCTRKRCCEQKN
jgi:hypothetical protein